MDKIKADGLEMGQKTSDARMPVSFSKILNKIKEGTLTNVVTLVGAGISTAAGIPDFRSPSSGIYDQMKDYNLPFKTAVFDAYYFEEHPEPLFKVLKEIFFSKQPKPTKAHYFIKLLDDKRILRRHYTQNIDGLDRLSGIPPEKIVEAHGTLRSAHCSGCQETYTLSWIVSQLEQTLVPKCEKCTKVVRPDIILFGEYLPECLLSGIAEDAANCDLLIVIGTSLVVHPIASLVASVGPQTLRLFINKSPLGEQVPELMPCMGERYNFPNSRVWLEGGNRDAVMYGDSDECVEILAALLEWDESLQQLYKQE